MARKRRHPRKPQGPKPATEWEKTKARNLADRYGLPVSVTLRIIRGELEITRALEEKHARKKMKELIEKGINPQLAGQVARGKIDEDTARLRSQILELQHKSFYYNKLNSYKPGDKIALFLFEYGTLTGTVKDMAPYDLDIIPQGSTVPVLLKKHDIKIHCNPEDLGQTMEAITRDEEVAALGLGASVNLEDRYRPQHEEALIWLSMQVPVRFVLRDGDVVTGKVKRCGKYEIEVELSSGVTVYVMTHAIFKNRPPTFINM